MFESFFIQTEPLVPVAIVLPVVIPIIALCLLTLAGIYILQNHPLSIVKALTSFLRIFAIFRLKNVKDVDSFNRAIKFTGFQYDPKQDIFYSTMNCWQRNFGYCRLYDEACAPLGMIVDCEPITFKYNGRKWMIEFWKGQYDLCTGAEIGVYSTRDGRVNIPNLFTGTFYDCVGDEDRLNMSFALRKGGKTIITRREKHWWLTGFILGEFSEPSELVMYISITLKDQAMRNAFLNGLFNVGYTERDLIVEGNRVSIRFDKPRTKQPITRTSKTDWLIQRKNEEMCRIYRSLVKGYSNIYDKVRAAIKNDKRLTKEVLNIGKAEQVFKLHSKIKRKTV